MSPVLRACRYQSKVNSFALRHVLVSYKPRTEEVEVAKPSLHRSPRAPRQQRHETQEELYYTFTKHLHAATVTNKNALETMASGIALTCRTHQCKSQMSYRLYEHGCTHTVHVSPRASPSNGLIAHTLLTSYTHVISNICTAPQAPQRRLSSQHEQVDQSKDQITTVKECIARNLTTCQAKQTRKHSACQASTATVELACRSGTVGRIWDAFLLAPSINSSQWRRWPCEKGELEKKAVQ
jgi:hypothetical protein